MEDKMRELAAMAAEPLLDELKPYVVEGVFEGSLSLKHPLVFDILLTLPGHANARYLQKKAALEEALAARDWARVIWLHERPYRFEALMTCFHAGAAENGGAPKFWELVSDVWIDSENIWQHYDEWTELFESVGSDEKWWLMEESDAAAYAELPEVLTIWRGAQREINEDGMSYTLDRSRAVWFAKRFKRDGEPVLIEARVKKADVIAHFTGRNESEIVALPEAVEIVCYHELED